MCQSEARLRFLTQRGNLVHYEIDEDESKHLLSLNDYGHQEAEVTDAWVLLEAEKE